MATALDQIVRAEGLGIELPHRVIGPFDLSVNDGETVALVGPNGSGKTTFLKLLLGITRPSFGRSQIMGREVGPLSPPKGVGYVADKAEFWDWMSARDNLRLFYDDGAAVTDTLELVGLLVAQHLPVRAYSRGMRQRLSVGRALLNSPRLLVMDEPTIALDEEATLLLGRIVRERQEGGLSTIVTSHDEPFITRLHARIVTATQHGFAQ